MTNKELFDNNNEEIDNHDSTWKEFADAEIKWDLDALKQHVHHESNEHALDIERQLWEIKTDVLLQTPSANKKEYIPHTEQVNDELLARANEWRQQSKVQVENIITKTPWILWNIIRFITRE